MDSFMLGDSLPERMEGKKKNEKEKEQSYFSFLQMCGTKR